MKSLSLRQRPQDVVVGADDQKWRAGSGQWRRGRFVVVFVDVIDGIRAGKWRQIRMGRNSGRNARLLHFLQSLQVDIRRLPAEDFGTWRFFPRQNVDAPGHCQHRRTAAGVGGKIPAFRRSSSAPSAQVDGHGRSTAATSGQSQTLLPAGEHARRTPRRTRTGQHLICIYGLICISADLYV